MIKKIFLHEIEDILVSPPFNAARWQGVILHHSTLMSFEHQGKSIDHMHRNGLRQGYPPFKYGMGYHILINADGSIEVGDRWIRQLHGAHCVGYNQTHLGVCLAGNFDVMPPRQLQIDTLMRVIDFLAKYGITKWGPHWRYRDTKCPGKLAPIDIIMNVKNRR